MSIIDSDGLPVALVRRFDRPEGSGRLMYVSAATMLGVDPRDGAEHSYTDIAEALRRHGASPREDIEELWRRIAFSILITNVVATSSTTASCTPTAVCGAIPRRST